MENCDWNEKTKSCTQACKKGTPAESRYGRDVKPDKVKPLAQYLAQYLWREVDVDFELLEQALDAYENTEQVKIRIERV